MDNFDHIDLAKTNRMGKTDQKYLWSALIIMAANWLVFKHFYPYPNLIFDSYSYVRAAALDLSINAWPIGYSRFLQLFGLITHSANALVSFQYLLLMLSCLSLFLTWRRIFKPAPLISILFFILLFANPLFLYCSNYILSDTLFIALSLLWATQLLWIIYRPRPWMIVTHALLLALAFTIRYNAMYYPLLAGIAYLLSRQRPLYKLMGISLPLLLVGSFIWYTSGQVQALTGHRQFSPFGGWKMANNALYAYVHVVDNMPHVVPKEFRKLDSTVRYRFTHSGDWPVPIERDPSHGSCFMFNPYSPLVNYMGDVTPSGWPNFGSRRWMDVGSLYQSYGMFLIKKYPSAFFEHFILLTFTQYVQPPGEIFGTSIPFYLMDEYGAGFARNWFGLKTITPSQSSIDISYTILSIFTTFFTIVHLLFFLGLVAFFIIDGFKKTKNSFSNCILFILSLWLVDFFFSIFSACIVLRYQIFIVILEMGISLYFIDFVVRFIRQTVERKKVPAVQ